MQCDAVTQKQSVLIFPKFVHSYHLMALLYLAYPSWMVIIHILGNSNYEQFVQSWNGVKNLTQLRQEKSL